MKMKLLDRILLTVFTLITIALSLTFIIVSLATATGIISQNQIQDFLQSLTFGWEFIGLALVLSILFLLVSLKLLLSGTAKSKPQSSLLKITELGMIRVSVNTLDTLTQKAVRGFDQVKDVKSLIISEPDGIRVQLKILTMPEVRIPELTQSIQEKVKEYVESLSGIAIKEVRIFVDNVTTPQRPRVE